MDKRTYESYPLPPQYEEKFRLFIPFWLVYVMIIISVIIVGRFLIWPKISKPINSEITTHISSNTHNGKEEAAKSESPSTYNIQSSSIIDSYEDGFVFLGIDKRYLTDSEIENLSIPSNCTKSEILQRAINDVYALSHYHFETEEIRDYYNNLPWYEDWGLSKDEAVASFNEYQAENINKLVEYRDDR